VSVSLGVMDAELETEIMVSSADELVIDSLLDPVDRLCAVSIVEKVVNSVDMDELSPVVTFGGSVVVLEELATPLAEEVGARLEDICVTVPDVDITFEIAGVDEVVL